MLNTVDREKLRMSLLLLEQKYGGQLELGLAFASGSLPEADAVLCRQCLYELYSPDCCQHPIIIRSHVTN